MPRPSTVNINNILFQRVASQPYVQLTIQWQIPGAPDSDFGYAQTYSELTNQLDVGQVTISRRDDYTGSTGSTSITLDDSDGKIKELMSIFRLEAATCWLSQQFVGTDEGLMLLIGKATEIVWSEGERKVSFILESEVISKDMGFAPTFDDYPDLNPDALGIPWPTCFGTPIHVPAIHAYHRKEGFLQSNIQLYSDVFKLDTPLPAPPAPPDPNAMIQAAIDGAAGATKPQTLELIPDCEVHSYEFIQNTDSFTGDEVVDLIYVRDGELFPQGTSIKLSIGGIYFQGTFDDNVFTVTTANCPKYTDLQLDTWAQTAKQTAYTCQILPRKYGIPKLEGTHCYFDLSGNDKPFYNYCVKQEGVVCTFMNVFIDDKGNPYLPTGSDSIGQVYPVERFGLLGLISVYYEKMTSFLWFNKPDSRPSIQWTSLIRRIQEMKAQDRFWSAPEETPVFLWHDDDSPEPEIYVCNLIPSAGANSLFVDPNQNSLKAVHAFYHNGHHRSFLPVPSDWYTFFSEYDLAGKNVTAITMNTLLSDYDSHWEDDLYVTSVSSVGTNVADIIIYILKAYSALIIDSNSFNLARKWLDPIPANFAVLTKENALRIAQKIAWSARCALSVVNNIAYLYYLPIVPSPIITVNEDSVEEKTFTSTFTEFSEIVTVLKYKWLESYKPRPARTYLDSKRHERYDPQHTYISTINTALFGVVTEDRDIPIYNSLNYVKLSGNFWATRISNSWTKIRCKTFLQGLLVLPWDGVFVEFEDQNIVYEYFAVVDSVTYDPKNKTVSLEVTMPIKQGWPGIDSNFWPFAEVVPYTLAPELQWKQTKYDKHRHSRFHFYDPTDLVRDDSNDVTATAVVTSTEAPPDSNTGVDSPDDDPIPNGSDVHTVNVYGKGTSVEPSQNGIVACSMDSGYVRWPGERVRVTVNKSGKVNTVASVDDKILQITGPRDDSESGLALGYYLGTMYSAGELFSKDVTSDLELSARGQGIPVIAMNVGESTDNGWTKSIINAFPYWVQVRQIESYGNGVIVASFFVEAKIIRHVRCNADLVFQISYRTNPSTDDPSDDWIDAI